ncbi:MAG: UDP-N-acetylmuramate dehydrogenase [Proteobacteria bacterium]|nr:UDP-N-acetylmuramate dehydrogenase [Pseudomonadota bacterium]MBU1717330.1 UDP-N-acetylmuramate dehydrogenase [Pseudomonadota bacterium]
MLEVQDVSSYFFPILKGYDIPVKNAELREKVQGFWRGEVVWDAPLADFSTMKVGGLAAALVIPSCIEDLSVIVAGAQKSGVSWRVIGRGSNILVPDEGFAGLVIVLGRDFSEIKVREEFSGQVRIRVESGCSLARLLNWCMEMELSGLEFTVGIPGSVGGSVVMNAGAWGHEIKEFVASVTWLDNDGQLVSAESNSIDFSYRQWGESRDKIVVMVDFLLFKRDRREIEAQCRELTRKRKERQPQAVASVGSFFKNPPRQAAGKLIEDAGLKGCRVGGAIVSEVHANFIVNTGGATAGDVLELMRIIQDKVWKKYGVRLEPEVHILNNDMPLKDK